MRVVYFRSAGSCTMHDSRYGLGGDPALKEGLVLRGGGGGGGRRATGACSCAGSGSMGV